MRELDKIIFAALVAVSCSSTAYGRGLLCERLFGPTAAPVKIVGTVTSFSAEAGRTQPTDEVMTMAEVSSSAARDKIKRNSAMLGTAAVTPKFLNEPQLVQIKSSSSTLGLIDVALPTQIDLEKAHLPLEAWSEGRGKQVEVVRTTVAIEGHTLTYKLEYSQAENRRTVLVHFFVDEIEDGLAHVHLLRISQRKMSPSGSSKTDIEIKNSPRLTLQTVPW